jgi:hypothetical protein
MTISLLAKLRETDVVEVIPVVYRLAGNPPALKMVKSGSPKSANSALVGRMSILFIKRARYNALVGKMK